MKTKEPSIALLILMISYAAISAVLFTPSLPMLAENLSMPDSTIEMTIVIFLFGYAFGQLLYGPLAGAFGRKKALHIGLCIALCGELISLCAVTFGSLNFLLFGRVLTAIGACSGYTITFAIIQDAFDLDKARKVLATVILSFAIAPGLAVGIGAFLVNYFGPTACFYVLFLYGLFILIVSRSLPETRQRFDKSQLNVNAIIRNYRNTLKNKRFLLYGICTGIWGSFLYVYYADAPFIATEDFHFTLGHYGMINLTTSIAYILGNITSRFLANKNSAEKVIHIGLRVLMMGIILLTFEYFDLFHWDSLYFIGVAVCFLGGSMMVSNLIALGMNEVTDVASGAAMFGFLNLAGPAFSVLLSGYFGAIHTGTFLLIYLVLMNFLLFFYRQARRVTV
jgi:DHA1 family bicyclomycin/chloramphenicol resistance-like MFS transporter